MCLLPVSIESRSAFFRLLCNIEDGAVATSDESVGDCKLTIANIILSLLRCLHIEGSSSIQIHSRLDLPIPPSRIQSLICKESKAAGVAEVLDFASGLLESRGATDLPVNDSIRDKISELLHQNSASASSSYPSNFQLPPTVGTITLKKVLLGTFSGLLLTDRRDVAAVIAVILFRRIDIACLCLKPSSLSHEESLKLLQFCAGDSILESRSCGSPVDGTTSHSLLRFQKFLETSNDSNKLVLSNPSVLNSIVSAFGFGI
jgi:hypothetical protein